MSSNTLNSTDLQQFIRDNRIEATILAMDVDTPTVSDAARALGVGVEKIIKSLLFTLEGQPLLVINNGTARVDRYKLAARFGVGRKRIKFASADQALSITGYVVGSMPPFGHRQKLRTLVDPAVEQLEMVFGGGGAIDAMMRLTPPELLRVTGAEVVPVSE